MRARRTFFFSYYKHFEKLRFAGRQNWAGCWAKAFPSWSKVFRNGWNSSETDQNGSRPRPETRAGRAPIPRTGHFLLILVFSLAGLLFLLAPASTQSWMSSGPRKIAKK